MSNTLGRLEGEKDRSVVHDLPNETGSAILSKLDEVIDKLNALGAAVEAATDGNSLFAGLDVAAIKDAVKKIDLIL